MGLDITYGRQIHRLSDKDPMADEGEGEFFIRRNDAPFTAQNADLPAGVYQAERTEHFRAGSYSGYNDWRNKLCLMAHGITADTFWNIRAMPGPNRAFAEIINFSDCEGTIGPTVARKLAADFAEYDKQAHDYAKALDPTTGAWWIDIYHKFKEAFETAADSGFVKFA